MRWLLPLILVVALAICVIDHVSAGERRQPPRDRRTGAGGPQRPQARDDASVWQHGTFDAATGTLTWFDEVYN